MSSSRTKLIIALLVLLFLAGGVYLYVTTNEEMGEPIENVERTGEEPPEVRDDEVDLPDYTRDSLNLEGIQDEPEN